VWLVLARALPSQLMPGPLSTLAFIAAEYQRGALLFNLGATAERVLVAFSVGMLLGVIAGAAMGLSRTVDRLLGGWLLAGLTVPRIVLFVVAYLLLGLNDVAAIGALVITITPTVVVQLREGTRALDTKLLEMAHAFGRRRTEIWLRVILPQLMPYVIGTARASLSLAWKMVVLAELLGRTNGVGYMISFYFQMFNMKGVLAYGVTMMVVLAVIDVALLGTLQRRAFRWRTTGTGEI
jgi:NitT/TauT family transport system permease protein